MKKGRGVGDKRVKGGEDQEEGKNGEKGDQGETSGWKEGGRAEEEGGEGGVEGGEGIEGKREKWEVNKAMVVHTQYSTPCRLYKVCTCMLSHLPELCLAIAG